MKTVVITLFFTCDSVITDKQLNNFVSDIEELVGKKNYDLDGSDIDVEDDEEDDL